MKQTIASPSMNPQNGTNTVGYIKSPILVSTLKAWSCKKNVLLLCLYRTCLGHHFTDFISLHITHPTIVDSHYKLSSYLNQPFLYNIYHFSLWLDIVEWRERRHITKKMCLACYMPTMVLNLLYAMCLFYWSCDCWNFWKDIIGRIFWPMFCFCFSVDTYDEVGGIGVVFKVVDSHLWRWGLIPGKKL